MGCIGSQTEDANVVEEVEDGSSLLKYENSDDEMDTPSSSDAKDMGAIKLEERRVLWLLGQTLILGYFSAILDIDLVVGKLSKMH